MLLAGVCSLLFSLSPPPPLAVLSVTVERWLALETATLPTDG